MLRILKSTLPVFISVFFLAAFFASRWRHFEPRTTYFFAVLGLSVALALLRIKRPVSQHLNLGLAFLATALAIHFLPSIKDSPPDPALRVPLELRGKVRGIWPKEREMSDLLFQRETLEVRPLQHSEFSSIAVDVSVRLPNSCLDKFAVGDLLSVQGWLENSARGGVMFRCDQPLQIRHLRDAATISAHFATLRRDFSTLLEEKLRPQSADLVRGITTGIRPSNPENMAPFKESGVAHFFAVSGIHLAILAWALQGILRFCLPYKKLADLLLLAALFGFALFVGHRPSVLRALAFLLAAMLSRQLGRPLSLGWSLLSITSLFLLVQPELAKDAGFLLTVSALVGIIWIGFPLAKGESQNEIQAWLRRKGHPSHRLIDLARSSCAVSYGASCATLPITVFTFGSLAPLSVLATPLLGPAVAGLLLGGLTLPILDWHAPLVDLLAEALINLARLLATTPGAYFDHLEPRLEALGFYYLCLALAVYAGAKRARRHRLKEGTKSPNPWDRLLFFAPILGFAAILATAESAIHVGPRFYESRGIWNWTLEGDTQKLLVSNRGVAQRLNDKFDKGKSSRHEEHLRVIRRRKTQVFGPRATSPEQVAISKGVSLLIWRSWNARGAEHAALLLNHQGHLTLDLQGLDAESLATWLSRPELKIEEFEQLLVPPDISDALASELLGRFRPQTIRLSQWAIQSERYDSWLRAAAEIPINLFSRDKKKSLAKAKLFFD